MKLNFTMFMLSIFMLGNVNLYAQNYPDQQIVLSRTDFVTNYIQEKEGVEINHNTGEVTLNSNNTKGYIITKPISFDKPFNHGLPSWNGYTSENRNSYFMVFMKFKVDGVWTDSRVYTMADGEQVRSTNTKDGFAVKYAQKMGYPIANWVKITYPKCQKSSS